MTPAQQSQLINIVLRSITERFVESLPDEDREIGRAALDLDDLTGAWHAVRVGLCRSSGGDPTHLMHREPGPG
jgi:hypothetical protein